MNNQRKELEKLKEQKTLLEENIKNHKNEILSFEEKSRQQGLKIELRKLKNKMGIF